LEISNELIYRYPWLPSINRILSSHAKMEPIDFVKFIFEKYPADIIKTRIMEFFKTAFKNLEEISSYRSDELNMYSYLILKILLDLINDRIVSNRIANLYSKIGYSELIKETDANIYWICQDLKLDIKYYTTAIPFRTNVIKDQLEIQKANFTINYIDYLKLSANLRDEYRKLVNNALLDGYVFLIDLLLH
jgi:hypothetical protein